MRKLIVSMNVTLDGYMSGPNCELDWHFQTWTKEMADLLFQQLNAAEAILLGRITYNAMAKYWPAKAVDPSFPREDIAFADLMNRQQKLVVSSTLKQPEWNNSTLLRGNLRKEVLQLKNSGDRDIIVYGSRKIVHALIHHGLIDQYQLWIHPVLLGEGKPLFNGFAKKVSMKLTGIKRFESGVVTLYYEPNSQNTQMNNASTSTSKTKQA